MARALPLLLFAAGCGHRQAGTATPEYPAAVFRRSPAAVRGKPLSELIPIVAAYGITDWALPLSGDHKAGSPYGMRRSPISGRMGKHHGQDIGCRRGTRIKSVAAGTVVVSRRSKSAGRYVQISHPNPSGEQLTTTYMHLSRRKVKTGRAVRRGKVIGKCGSTGNSTGPHLHFEVRVNGRSLPPFFFLD